MNLVVVKDYNEMSNVSANIFKNTINQKSNSVLGLATGSTPIGLYKRLIEMNNNKEIDFKNVTTINLDEYIGLDEKNPQSYRYFMDNNLFNYINIKKENTFVPNGRTKNFDLECKNYDKRIQELGGIDLQVLGIGANGHIAFNEPSEYLISQTHVTNLTKSTIEANSRFFNSINDVPKQAITMGIGQIMNTKKIILMATGKDKVKAIRELLEGNITTKNPATILNLHKNVTVIIDELIAREINR